ncbi:MAG: TonB-dependent receptor [Polymorphobacter sp.]
MIARLMTTVSLGALVLTAAAASAQTAAADDGGVAEIVVTAQKRAENVQDVPIAISAIGSAYLESRGVTSIESLGAIAPNVKIERAPSNKTISQISIRGSVTINPAITWEPAVGLYLDGVYIAKAQGSIFDVADLERVEVLRGPQGTLYGRNALAGAVNLVTKKPTGELGGLGEFTYGNFDQVRGRAVLNLPRAGVFSLKLSGQIQKRDGFIKIGPNPFPQAFLARPNSVDSTNDVDGWSGMAQLRIEPSDNLLIDYAFDYSRFDQRPDYAQLVSVNRNGDPRDIFDPNSPSYPFAGAFFPLNLYTNADRQSNGSIDADPLFEKSRVYGHALTIAYDFGNATLKSITAYRNVEFSDSLDLDGSPLNVAFTQRFTEYDAFSQELQLVGTAFGDKLNYVLGGFYYTETAETLGPQSFFGGGTAFQSDYGSNTDAWALSAQFDYAITNALKLTVGGRYTHEKKDVRRFLRSLGPPAPVTIADIPYGGVPDATFNDFSPAATISYAISEDINVYGRYAQGFKSGGFNGESNAFGAPTAACPTGAFELCDPYRPETVDSFELGLKTSFFDRRLTLNFAVFNDEHKDIQLSIFQASGAASSTVRNAAEARIRGLEIEFVARPVDALTLNGSFAFLDAKYKSYVDGGVDVADNRAFPHTPEFTMNLGANWQVVAGKWGRLNLIADVSHVSSYFTFPYALTTPTKSDQNAFNTQSPGRTIVNLRAVLGDFMIGGVKTEIAGWVRNLTQEDRPQNFIDFGPGFGGLTVGYFPDPRTYGLTAGVRF